MTFRRFGLRHKLVALIVMALVFALGVAGFWLSYILGAYHRDQAQARFIEAFGTITSNLQRSELRLERDVNVLVRDRDVIASANMVSGYASVEDYQAIIFDPEKRSIARELESVLRVTSTDQLAVYQDTGDLMAFGFKEADSIRVGIISYENGHPVVMISDDLASWEEGELPASLARTRPSNGLEETEYQSVGAGLMAVTGESILRHFPGGAESTVGYVIGAAFVDEGFVENIGRETQVTLTISVPGSEPVGEIAGLAQVPELERVPTLEEAARAVQLTDREDFFLSAAYLPLASGNQAYFLLGQPKDEVNAQIRRTRTVVLVVLGLSALLMVPLGTAIARRMISTPLERLVSAVEELRRGHYGIVVRIESKDEIGELADAFNVMSETIRQREGQLKESEANYRRLIETSEEGVWVTDAQGRTLFVNPTMAGMLGTTVESMQSSSLFEFLDEESRQWAESQLLLRARGSPEPRDICFHRRDDRELWAIVSASPIQDDEGRIAGALAMVTDITERKRNEDTNVLLQSINQQVLEGMEPDDVLQMVCVETVRMFQFPLVWVGIKEDDGRVTVAAQAGEKTDYLGRIEVRWDAGPKGRGPTGHAIRTGEARAATMDDPSNEAWREAAADYGFAASAALPLVAVKGEVIGALTIYSQHVDVFTPSAMQRLGDLANRATVAYTLAVDQARLRLQGTAMDAAANAILITDPDGYIEWVNRAFVRFSGYRQNEAIGKKPSLLKSGQYDRSFYESLWRTILRGEVWQHELVNRRKDGSLYTIEQTITPLLDEDGSISHFIAIQEDVTARKEAEAHIRYMEQYDRLTGLPNRMLLLDRLRQALAHAERNRRQVAVIQLDLDRFKDVNDSLGPSAGDELLKQVAQVLTQCVHADDTVSRQGGDEFTLLLDDLRDADQAVDVAQRIVTAFGRPFEVVGEELFVTCSMGIALYPIDAQTPDGLIKAADTAMFGAKAQGRNSYRFFTTDLNLQATARLKLENALRRALERGEFILHYQPQVDAADGHIIAAEALIRWQSPEMGLVAPKQFIPVAADTGLIVPIGEWVLRNACRTVRQWHDAGYPLRMAVNLSAIQLYRGDMGWLVGDVLKEESLEPHWLELEITESELMRSPEAARKTLGRLKEMDVHIAIDDFGTGYSSFSQLRSLPVHRLKIDRSFVDDVSSADGAAITAAIISLGHSLKLEVIAEGVENESQLICLREQGCDALQGYYFSKPLPADAFEALLKSPGD
ncbi:EAL domain-containing protein [Thiohalomonas denitrificans]|uniref:EAL domain-containing protein n=1 Tax=Thiohalomonas denitrificans TaxID=415747 RepID=UPI0026ED98F9|nr:EAL domain-containing protein [Thiohalomonas denitrificans]